LTSVERIAEYLVSLALTGRQQALAALELWSTNCSPSEIEVVTGLPKNRVRGYIRRVCEKAAGPRRALAIARALLPMVRGVEPIVVNGECRVCGAYVGDSYTAAMHVKSRHRDLVLRVSLQVVEELRRRVRA
jgi:DNA-binding CsgD family transcriptional regulator